MATTTTKKFTQAAADAVVRLLGVDRMVDDYTFDPESGHRYFLDDANVLTVPSPATVTITDLDGKQVVADYADETTLAPLTFTSAGGLVEMHQFGTYIASEAIV